MKSHRDNDTLIVMPGEGRASTSCFLALPAKKDVDGRDKPGHDGDQPQA
jgi:hypothetical protein